MPTPDMVNNPPHYTKHPSGVECITIARHWSYNIGNVFKYIWRHKHKGTPIQDLEKAVFYLNDEIAKLRDEEANEEYYGGFHMQDNENEITHNKRLKKK